MKTAHTEFLLFALSGIAGFVVNAGIVYGLTNFFHWGPIFAQMLAFSCAVTVTWLMNRRITFAHKASPNWLRELMLFVTANSIGALVNNGVYVALVLTVSIFHDQPVLAVAVGSLAGLGFNFSASRAWVFRSR